MNKSWIISYKKDNGYQYRYKKTMEAPGIDPGTSRMLSERSTI
jgi:hypothetical protein